MENFAISTLVKWLHIMATLAWIGGMFTNFFLYLPAMGKVLDPPTLGKLMGTVMKRFRIIAYISIAILLLSGLFMALSHGAYEEMFHFNNRFKIILLLKQLIFLVMIVMVVYAFEVLAPKVARKAIEGPSPELARMQKFQMSFATVGFILGILVLILTATL